MSKTEVTGIKLLENPRYYAIIALIKLINYDKKKIIRYKHLKYVLVKNHGIDTDNKRIMKDINDTLRFEEIDRKKSSFGLDKDKEVNILTGEKIKEFRQKEKNIKDYASFFRLRYIGNSDEFIFNNKNILSNNINLLIKRKIINKSSDKKGNYYFLTDYGKTLLFRHGLLYYAKFLPDEKVISAYKMLQQLASS